MFHIFSVYPGYLKNVEMQPPLRENQLLPGYVFENLALEVIVTMIPNKICGIIFCSAYFFQYCMDATLKEDKRGSIK